MTSDLAKKAQTAVAGPRKREGGEAFVFGIRDEVAELLEGSPFSVDSYLQAAYRVVSDSNDLVLAAKNHGSTVLGAIMLGARLQLPIGGPLGQFYLTPRGIKNRQTDQWEKMCVPMIGYRGFFELGYRSGRISAYQYQIVREGDHFDEFSNAEKGNWYEFRKDRNGGDDRPLTDVIAIAKLTNGDVQFESMSAFRIERRRPDRTQNTPWEGKHAEAMYVKTAHRELAKYQQLTVQQAEAVERDELIQRWNGITSSLDVIRDEQGEQAALPAGEVPPGDDEYPPTEENTPTGQQDPAPAESAPPRQGNSDGIVYAETVEDEGWIQPGAGAAALANP
jgi:recombination protein RecT